MEKLRKTSAGFSFIEVMIGMVVLALVALAAARGFLLINKQSVVVREKGFAMEKAIQMIEELRGLVASSSSVGVLDDYDDGTVLNPILTTRIEVTSAADPVSGNATGKYARRISVISLPNEPLARRVYVRVYRAAKEEVLAETVSVLRTLSNDYPPTQVYDVYVLSLENVPGWWVSLSTMKPMMDNIIQDLQTRNPGLEWRTHWITRLSYGRDPYYTPTINSTTKTNLVSPTHVYFYPGLMDKPSVGDFYYYVPANFTARMKVDGTLQTGVYNYSLADQYNNAVRYPDEVSMYADHVTAAQAAGQPTPEISLRMLLEKMNSSSSLMKNILIVNLHGEMVPLPPLRNYSDPAKDPTDHANVRVVSHPERIQYVSSDTAKIRVYSYVTNPDSWSHDAVLSSLSVYFPNVQLNSSQISIRKIVGNQTTDYVWSTASLGSDYTVTNPSSGQTLITINNSPLRHTYKATTPKGGLDSAYRLYGLEYIPCEVGNPGEPDFPETVKTLDDNNANNPKNTARWVISITGGLSTGLQTIETRIGNDLTEGVAGNKPENLSRTYFWIDEAPPITEQYQFTGDPRHLPYTDVKRNHGYNMFFTTVASGDYQGFSKDNYGFGNRQVNLDVPRFWQLFRTGLLNTGGVMNSITGWSYYYIGVGGEMGYDNANQFPNGLPIIGTPWSPTSTSQANVDEISEWGGASTRNMRVISNAANTWWGIYWLGELYPDSAFSTWQTDGNLPVGSGNYYRANFFVKAKLYNPYKQPGTYGSSSFFNGNPSGNSGTAYFSHDGNDSNTGAISTVGTEVSQDFNFPLLNTLTASRPFRLDHSSSDRRPPEWTEPEYSSQRTTTSFLEYYYNATQGSSHRSSALVRMVLGSLVGYVEVNGLSTQASFGTAQIGKLSVLNLIRAFMTAGNPAITTGRIMQLPLLTITSPTVTDEFDNPSTVNVAWDIAWTRWDNRLYTSAYSAGFSESATMIYNAKYSNDNGRTWYFVNDGVLTAAGTVDASHAVVTPLTWNVSGLARGTYILRVEAFRSGYPLHYSYQQRQIYVMR